MNILFVDQFSEPGGAQLSLLDVIDGIAQRGWASRIVAPGSGPLIQPRTSRGIPVHSLPLRPLTNARKSACDTLRFLSDLPRMRSALRRITKRHLVDLVY